MQMWSCHTSRCTDFADSVPGLQLLSFLDTDRIQVMAMTRSLSRSALEEIMFSAVRESGNKPIRVRRDWLYTGRFQEGLLDTRISPLFKGSRL